VLQFLYNTRHDWKKKKTMTAWKRDKAPAWIWQQKKILFRVFAVFALKMDVSGKTKEKAM